METSKRNANFNVWKIGGVVLLIIICLFGIVKCSSVQNQQVSLVNEFEAQGKKIEAVHDNVWRTISQKAQVAQEYASQFDSIYSHIMDARYSHNDGVLMNWIKESNPDFNAGMYKELSITIEVHRKQFLGAQEKIVDIVREHNTLLMTIPSKWFLGGCRKLEYEVISSSHTKNVMQTRVDDDDSVFKK